MLFFLNIHPQYLQLKWSKILQNLAILWIWDNMCLLPVNKMKKWEKCQKAETQTSGHQTSLMSLRAHPPQWSLSQVIGQTHSQACVLPVENHLTLAFKAGVLQQAINRGLKSNQSSCNKAAKTGNYKLTQQIWLLCWNVPDRRLSVPTFPMVLSQMIEDLGHDPPGVPGLLLWTFHLLQCLSPDDALFVKWLFNCAWMLHAAGVQDKK